jgi:hypothetical protein
MSKIFYYGNVRDVVLVVDVKLLYVSYFAEIVCADVNCFACCMTGS